MMRKFRLLGLLLSMSVALCAAYASGANAANFESSKASTTLTGAQSTQLVFTNTSGMAKCTTATFHGSMSGTSVTSVTLTPHYTECKWAGLKATVDMNGCAYILTNTGATTVSTDLECTGATKYIAWTLPGLCEARIGPQTGVGTISLSNIAGDDIVAAFNATGIVYDEIGPACAGGPGEKTGALAGSVVLNGDDTGSSIFYT